MAGMQLPDYLKGKEITDVESADITKKRSL